ncbi:spore germination protein KB [Niallia circulans]|uniref:Uncharacterized protein n=1 Tax=Shouchella clausii TaxID=79880 RepID=A0A268S2L5_SHOCL|nr:endospore germination permease [Shouchella clausii]PAD43349.1 hypothetical protein CHH54_07315 [Bacillus sp. 7520-S]SPT78588.1 spore germination protein KB [Niallia circulans]MBU8596786.1 spore germination protein [Shouchella clausii]MCM3550998.1 spore germination protein [Shouchella clausii]MCY1104184.1 endospore germination permease [Shouchella clausii]
METNKRLGKTQLFWFYVQAQIGIGILSLPYSLYKEAQTDGWISLLMSAVLVQIALFVLWLLHKRFPNDHLFSICEKTLGVFAGKVLTLVYIVYFVYTAALVLKNFTQLIVIWILTKTPETVFMGLIIASCLPLLLSTLDQKARMFVLTAPLILLIPIVMIGGFFHNADFLNLLPIGVTEPSGLMKGTLAASFAINGYIVMSLIFPYVKATAAEKIKVVSLAHWVVTFIYLLVVLACYTSFSAGELKLLPEPFLYLIKSFSLPIVERIDLIFLCLWSVIVITTYAIYIYCGVVGTMTLFRSQRYHLFVILALLSTFLVNLMPDSIIQVRQMITRTDEFGTTMNFVIPLLLLLIAAVFKRRLNKRRSKT